MKSTLITLLAFILSGSLLAQAQQGQAQTEQKTASGAQAGKSIEATENELDKEIFRLNELMTRHTPLFKMKLKVLPYRTLVFKGKANGDVCEINKVQTDPANNCIRVEVFDFILDEYKYPTLNNGSKYKYMELFYEGAASSDPDPTKEPPRKLSKIKTNVYSNDFLNQEKIVTDVVDRSPNSSPGHNDKIEMFYQKNDYPEKGLEEDMSEKGLGVFKLSNVENTLTNPIRNNFKQKVYIKYLDYFNRLFTKIYDYNDRDLNARYKTTVNVLKENLDY